MHDEISRMPDEQEETAQKGVLVLLLGSDSQRPWSVAELERERGEHLGIIALGKVAGPRRALLADRAAEKDFGRFAGFEVIR